MAVPLFVLGVACSACIIPAWNAGPEAFIVLDLAGNDGVEDDGDLTRRSHRRPAGPSLTFMRRNAGHFTPLGHGSEAAHEC